MTEEINTWFNSLDRLEGILVSAFFFYFFVVLMIRISGKRTVAQMNNFDWILTVAVGSLMSSGILLEDVTIMDAIAAIVVITGLQWITVWLASKSKAINYLIKPRPELLTHNGEMLEKALKRTRVSKEEIYAGLREHGIASIEDANWVVLENSGKLSVIPSQNVSLHNAELLSDVMHDVSTENSDSVDKTDKAVQKKENGKSSEP